MHTSAGDSIAKIPSFTGTSERPRGVGARRSPRRAVGGSGGALVDVYSPTTGRFKEAKSQFTPSLQESQSLKQSPVQVTPFPEYPELQAQVNDPGVLVHVAVPDAQFEVPAVHSLMSIPIQRAFRHKETKPPRKEEKKKKRKNSPVQVTPFPE